MCTRLIQYISLLLEGTFRGVYMKHIKTVASNCMKKDGNIGCGECQSSCQSACKTSCTVGNQSCKNREEKVQVKKVEK